MNFPTMQKHVFITFTIVTHICLEYINRNYILSVPYQNNSWDCGVFVCQYAFSLYKLRYQQITYGDLQTANPLENTITNNDEMKFDMKHIATLRKEMGKLVDNLSIVYSDITKKNGDY